MSVLCAGLKPNWLSTLNKKLLVINNMYWSKYFEITLGKAIGLWLETNMQLDLLSLCL